MLPIADNFDSLVFEINRFAETFYHCLFDIGYFFRLHPKILFMMMMILLEFLGLVNREPVRIFALIKFVIALNECK